MKQRKCAPGPLVSHNLLPFLPLPPSYCPPGAVRSRDGVAMAQTPERALSSSGFENFISFSSRIDGFSSWSWVRVLVVLVAGADISRGAEVPGWAQCYGSAVGGREEKRAVGCCSVRLKPHTVRAAVVSPHHSSTTVNNTNLNVILTPSPSPPHPLPIPLARQTCGNRYSRGACSALR